MVEKIQPIAADRLTDKEITDLAGIWNQQQDAKRAIAQSPSFGAPAQKNDDGVFYYKLGEKINAATPDSLKLLLHGTTSAVIGQVTAPFHTAERTLKGEYVSPKDLLSSALIAAGMTSFSTAANSQGLAAQAGLQVNSNAISSAVQSSAGTAAAGAAAAAAASNAMVTRRLPAEKAALADTSDSPTSAPSISPTPAPSAFPAVAAGGVCDADQLFQIVKGVDSNITVADVQKVIQGTNPKLRELEQCITLAPDAGGVQSLLEYFPTYQIREDGNKMLIRPVYVINAYKLAGGNLDTSQPATSRLIPAASAAALDQTATFIVAGLPEGVPENTEVEAGFFIPPKIVNGALVEAIHVPAKFFKDTGLEIKIGSTTESITGYVQPSVCSEGGESLAKTFFRKNSDGNFTVFCPVTRAADSKYVKVTYGPDQFFPMSAETAREEVGPVIEVTKAPTAAPTTENPTTELKTVAPTENPTTRPTTLRPTVRPSVVVPTPAPIAEPTGRPTTLAPSAKPTGNPIAAPTPAPIAEPTGRPTTLAPSAKPTGNPIAEPTPAPIAEPTAEPTTTEAGDASDNSMSAGVKAGVVIGSTAGVVALFVGCRFAQKVLEERNAKQAQQYDGVPLNEI